MNFTCQRPFALYGLILIIPGIILSLFQYKKVAASLLTYTVKDSASVIARRMKHFRVMISIRCICVAISWGMLILAYAGFSWGTYLEPVHKSGNAVSLVFDISYSMNADDCTGGLTRLEAAEKYCSMLLSQMPDCSASFVLAKGDGVVVLPLTEDKASMDSLLSSLSSDLMSATGTSLGKGVRAALKAFPENSSQRNTIWVFTDGDETDGLLENALVESIKAGVSTYIIGFGSERESKVLAGDRKNYVYTACRSERMRTVCGNAMKKCGNSKISDVKVCYVDSTEAGSALELLNPLSVKTITNAQDSTEEQSVVTYEIKPVQRYSLFLGLGIFFFALSYVITELDPENCVSKFHKNAAFMIVICSIFTSCNGRISGSKNILEGSWELYQRKYNDAIAKYLQTVYDCEKTEDKLVNQYAVYNLGVTYLSQNENDEALNRFNQLDSEVTNQVKYASFYNKGIIAHRKGDYDAAADYFRKALKIDGSKIDAKINLELSLMKAEKEANSRENALNQVSESNTPSTMEKAVFDRIREYDKKQWKNSEIKEISNSAQDY